MMSLYGKCWAIADPCSTMGETPRGAGAIALHDVH
jgi:hypothetical protein